MVDNAKLVAKIYVSGITLSDFAMKLGVSRQTLNQKLKNLRDWKLSEVKSLAVLLGLDDQEIIDIFFVKNVKK